MLKTNSSAESSASPGRSTPPKIDVRKSKGAKPSTAAMRIGLAEAPVSYGDVVYLK
jgi:hypothetical protein